MDSPLLSAIFIILLVIGSHAENITFGGSASSLSSAKQLCSQNGKTLITAESDGKMSDITNFLHLNNLTRAWLNAKFERLNHWRFTDKKGTLLKNHINTRNGGLCAALSSESEPKYKSFPCDQMMGALQTIGNKTTFSNKDKWHNLDKTLIATPTKNTIGNAAALFTIQRDFAAPLEPAYWVGLHKFRFTWPDKTEIPLRKYTWEDNSTNDGECLVLKDKGNLIVVDCNSENNYTVLCIPDPACSAVECRLWITIYVLEATFAVLAIISLGIGWYEMQNYCKKQQPISPSTEDHQGHNYEEVYLEPIPTRA